ncbi:unnamed protein product [Pleuronectes platessa]|uniref:Uncharacterized protein n=1 Tax=Pleuronectes platessa TaxID=8262 RepID=A0A9N7VGP9_PLEPL|nr:unnamed protein product [Pleuronectes platessa]
MPSRCPLWPCDGNQARPCLLIQAVIHCPGTPEGRRYSDSDLPLPVPEHCPGRLNVASAAAQSDVWLSVLNGLLAGPLAVVLVGAQPEILMVPDCRSCDSSNWVQILPSYTKAFTSPPTPFLYRPLSLS